MPGYSTVRQYSTALQCNAGLGVSEVVLRESRTARLRCIGCSTARQCSITTWWVLVFCGVCCGSGVVRNGDKRHVEYIVCSGCTNGTQSQSLQYCPPLQQYRTAGGCFPSWRVCAVFAGVAMIYFDKRDTGLIRQYSTTVHQCSPECVAVSLVCHVAVGW